MHTAHNTRAVQSTCTEACVQTRAEPSRHGIQCAGARCMYAAYCECCFGEEEWLWRWASAALYLDNSIHIKLRNSEKERLKKLKKERERRRGGETWSVVDRRAPCAPQPVHTSKKKTIPSIWLSTFPNMKGRFSVCLKTCGATSINRNLSGMAVVHRSNPGHTNPWHAPMNVAQL